MMSRRSAREAPMPWATNPSVRIDSMFCRGSRLDIGSWKIICMRRRIARSDLGASVVSSTPSNCTEPDVGGISWRMARPSVDLPQPDSPTRPYVLPRAIVRSTPSTALTWPTTRSKSTPRVIGKCTVRSRTASSGVPSSGREWGVAVITTPPQRSRGPTAPD